MTNKQEHTGNIPGAQKAHSNKSEIEHAVASVAYSVASYQADDEDELESDRIAHTELRPNNPNGKRRNNHRHSGYGEDMSRVYHWLQGMSKSADAEHAPEDASLSNVIIPSNETSVGGPMLRSYIEHATTSSDAPHNTNFDLKNDQERASEQAESQTTSVIAPAGPDALRALRESIDSHLLSRLPEYRSLEFSTHGKPRGFARLRLLVGDYGIYDMGKWGNTVWAYLKPSSGATVGPELFMEVEKVYETSGHKLERVVWEEDIGTRRVELIPVFGEARSQGQLCAIIKYYFLLATEASLYGFVRHFIPIDQAFIRDLRSVCEEWGTKLSSPAKSDISVYEDAVESPQHGHKIPDHRRTAGDADRGEVGKGVPASSSSYEDSDDTTSSGEEIGFDELKYRRRQSLDKKDSARLMGGVSTTKSKNDFYGDDDDNADNANHDEHENADEGIAEHEHEFPDTSENASVIKHRISSSYTSFSNAPDTSIFNLDPNRMHDDNAFQHNTSSSGSGKENTAPRHHSLHEPVSEHVRQGRDNLPDKTSDPLESRHPLSTLVDRRSDDSKQWKTNIRKIKKKVSEAQRQMDNSVTAITHVLQMLQDVVAENSRRMDEIKGMVDELGEMLEESEEDEEEEEEE